FQTESNWRQRAFDATYPDTVNVPRVSTGSGWKYPTQIVMASPCGSKLFENAELNIGVGQVVSEATRIIRLRAPRRPSRRARLESQTGARAAAVLLRRPRTTGREAPTRPHVRPTAPRPEGPFGHVIRAWLKKSLKLHEECADSD